MITKAIWGSITKTLLKKLRLDLREYKWSGARGLIRNIVPAMLYLLFKIINPDTRIGVSNLKDEIEKSTLAKFFINVKYLLYCMSSDYTIIICKGGCNQGFFCHIFRAPFSVQKSTMSSFIEITKDDRETGCVILSLYTIISTTEKYNNTVTVK